MSKLLKHFRFFRGNPFVAPRIVGNTVLGHLGVDRVRNAQCALTYKCNQKCKMCSSSAFIQKTKGLSLKEWKDVTDQLHALGCVHYDLTGGEPCLKGLDFLCKLVSHINRRKDTIVSLATNGGILQESWLGPLRKAGLNSVFFNLQSDKAREHNKIVGLPKSYEHIMEMIPKVKKAGLNVCINTCLTTDNFKQMRNLLKFCEENDMLLLINLAAPTGRWAEKRVRITKFRDRYYRFLNSSPNARADTSFNYRGKNLCPGGIEKVYVTAYGDIMQCTFTQLSYGNVRKEPLKTIYDRMRKNPYIKERSICKHSFNERFREEWLTPRMNAKKAPVDVRKEAEKLARKH